MPKFIEQEMLLRVNNTSEYFEKRWLLWRHIYTDIWYNCVIEKNDIFIKEMFSNCRIIKVFYIVRKFITVRLYLYLEK